MIKHIFFSSFQSAFVAAIFFTLVGWHDFGVVALAFGSVAFVVALLWCLLLSYPLIVIRQKYSFPEPAYFIIHCGVGLIAGSLTPVLISDASDAEFDYQLIKFMGLYGVFGMLSAVVAWNYIRKKYIK